MLILALLSASAFAAEPVVPRSATRLIEAVEAGDLERARATLTPDAMFTAVQGEEDSSTASLEDFARFVSGCRRSELTSESDSEDPSRTAVTVTWSCPSRASAQAFVWTDSRGVVNVEFGAAP
ncbi:MAG: nuclear transport factor 2 family protein [Allosphingosinicella sp.]